MIATALASLLIAHPIALRVIEQGRASANSEAIAQAIERALAERTRSAIRRVGANELPCAHAESCRAEIAQGGIDQVVRVVVIGGVTRSRAIAERILAASAAVERAEIDLESDPESWEPELATLARRLFPEAQAEAVRAEPARSKPRSAVPLIGVLAVSGLAVGVGALFWARADHLEQEVGGSFHPPGERPEFDRQVSGQRAAAGVSFGLAIAVALAGVITFWIAGGP